MIKVLRKNLKIFLVLLLIVFLYIVSSALTPFFIGIAISYISLPIMSFLINHLNIARKISVPLSVLIIYITLIACILLFIPFIYARLSEIVKSVATLNLTGVKINQELYDFIVSLKDIAISKIPGYITSITTAIISSTQSLISLIFSMIFAPIIAIYFLEDIQRSNDKTIKYLNNLAENFVKIQLLMIVFYAIYYLLLLLILGIKDSITLSFICSILYLMPYIGPIAGCVITSLMTITQYGIDFHIAVLIIGFLVVNIVENLFISPRLIGPRFGLHPLMIIFSLVVNSYLFGIAGMILAIPLGVIMKDIWLSSVNFSNKQNAHCKTDR